MSEKGVGPLFSGTTENSTHLTQHKKFNTIQQMLTREAFIHTFVQIVNLQVRMKFCFPPPPLSTLPQNEIPS